MKVITRSCLGLVVLLSPLGVRAQDTLPSIPRDLARVEIARSKACVESLGRLAELDAALQPYVQRVDRLNVLGRAVSMEKRQDAEPFDLSDSMQVAVAEWFATDSSLAARYLAEADSALLEERTERRESMLGKLRSAIQDLASEAETKLGDGAAIEAAAEPCVGALLVRSAVLEACGSTENPVCEAARAREPDSRYPFVEDAADLWDREEYGPWTSPAPLQFDPQGNLTGASTSARARIGNVAFVLSLRPLFRNRADLTEEEVVQYQANLDSLQMTFDHPQMVMAPGIEIQGTLPAPVGGETHYIVHFGNLSGDDVIWSMEAGDGGPFQAVFPATASDLVRLQAGEQVSLSAVRAPAEEGAPAELVFTLPLLQVGEASKVSTLLQYFSDGSLSRDLRALMPPGSGGSGGG